MNDQHKELTDDYTKGLSNYVSGAGESALQHAYELGRRAIKSGVGCLDLAHVHQEALVQSILGAGSGPEGARIARLGGAFFEESLSPYEMTHRGYHEVMTDLSRRAAELAVLNTRLEREIEERKKAERMLRALPERILDAQEAERRRVAHELHDDVCQRLSATKLHIGAFEQEVKQNPRLRSKLQNIKRQININIREVRRIAAHLRPAALDEIGLHVALRLLCEDFQQVNRATRAQFEMKAPSAARVGSHVELALYRIAQEGLSNVAKHAHAKKVLVRLGRENGFVRLDIRDNGRGFEVDRPSANSTRGYKLGLLNMKERAELLHGSCKITSAPGKGTHIRIEIPAATGPSHE
ncbi:MAG TPA: ATP-binding protein [Bacteroidota bacterium]|jgi:signal transduction histidine kinase